MADEKSTPESILRDVFDSEKHDDPDAKIQELGKEFVNRLFMLYRTGRIHDLGNEAVTNAIHSLSRVVEEIHTYLKEIQLVNVEDSFYLNKILLKVDFSTFENFRFLADNMKSLHISGFYFNKPTDADLRALLVAWKNSKSDPEEGEWLGRFSTPHLAVLPAEGAEESEKRMISPETLSDPNYLLRLYMKSLFGMRFFLSSLQSGEFISLSGLQRSTHEFIDAMGNDTRTILALSSIRLPDDRLACNAVNVALLSLLVGRELGLDRNKLSDLGTAAFLHDIGRVEISQELLDKKGSLTEEEKHTIRQSNRFSLMQLVKLRGFNESALRRMLVAFEHTLDASKERGFKKPTILARIVAIAHCYVAMTTPQPYRDAMLPAEALKLMMKDQDSKFDPKLLGLFVRLVTPYPPGTLLQLQDGEVVLVVDSSHGREHLKQPVVRRLYDSKGAQVSPKDFLLSDDNPNIQVRKGLDPLKYELNPLRELFPKIAHEMDESRTKEDTT